MRRMPSRPRPASAPRHRIVVLKASKPEIAKAKVAVPQGDSVIVSMSLAADALYLRTTVGGLERLERLNFGIAALHAVQMATFTVLPGWLVDRAGLPLDDHWKVYLAVLLASFVAMLPAIFWGERRGRMRTLFSATILFSNHLQRQSNQCLPAGTPHYYNLIFQHWPGLFLS